MGEIRQIGGKDKGKERMREREGERAQWGQESGEERECPLHTSHGSVFDGLSKDTVATNALISTAELV